jgi:hypothetical protein
MRDRQTGRWAAMIARVTAGAAAALRVARSDKAALDVTCTLTRPRDAAVWVMVDLVVRNLYPYDLHVVELKVLRPRRAQIWTDEEDRFWSLAFPRAQPRFRAARLHQCDRQALRHRARLSEGWIHHPDPAFRGRRALAPVLDSAPAWPDHADQDGPDVRAESSLREKAEIMIKRKIPHG